MLYLVLLLLSVFIAWIYLIYYFKNKYKKSLDSSKITFFMKKIKLISNSSFSYREKILEYDKIYHNILKEVWYSWTFWDILKTNPKEIDNINKIWELHKIRNKLAHDLSEIQENILLKNSIEFEKEILNLISKFK